MHRVLFFVSLAVGVVACTTNGDPPAGAVLDEAALPTLVEPTSPPPSAASPEGGTQLPDADADVTPEPSAPGPRDAGREADSVTPNRACADYVSPTTLAPCRGCPAGHVCQPNGCWGTYWCDVPVLRCVIPPTGC